MRIAESSIQMASRRSYRQGSTGTRGTGTGTGSLISGLKNQNSAQMSWKDLLDLSSGKRDTWMAPQNSGGGIGGIRQTDFSGGQVNDTAALRGSVARLLLSRMSEGGAFGGSTQELTYYEEESASFSAMGQVRTEDGRSIDFNIDVTMSRSFVQYTKVQLPALSGAFMDPLVINTGSAITSVSDQKFLFDLDGDGEEEYLSMPTRGSGFLALDTNGDGMINDGGELFGAMTGDGFGELRQYDEDGNGWIDENDPIFQKLKVWYKDEEGQDVLMDLKEADIGAIFLGEQATEFSLIGSSFGADAVIRSTGFFLKESGGAGTLQHVDLMTQSREEYRLMKWEMALSMELQATQTISARGSGLSGNLSGEGLTVTVRDNAETQDDSTVKSSEKTEQDKIRELEELNRRKKLERENLRRQEELRRRKRKERVEEETEQIRERREEEQERLEQLFIDRHEEASARREEAFEEAAENATEVAVL